MMSFYREQLVRAVMHEIGVLDQEMISRLWHEPMRAWI
jgi:hypothetical protein